MDSRPVSRKVSVDSAADAWTDDLLHAVYKLAFRQRSAWGWFVVTAFAAVPVVISYLCWRDGNIVCASVFAGFAVAIFALRVICIRSTSPAEPLHPYQSTKGAS